MNCSAHKKENVLSSLTKLAITPTDCCAINPGLTTSGILLIWLVLFQRLISRINYPLLCMPPFCVCACVSVHGVHVHTRGGKSSTLGLVSWEQSSLFF